MFQTGFSLNPLDGKYFPIPIKSRVYSIHSSLCKRPTWSLLTLLTLLTSPIYFGISKGLGVLSSASCIGLHSNLIDGMDLPWKLNRNAWLRQVRFWEKWCTTGSLRYQEKHFANGMIMYIIGNMKNNVWQGNWGFMKHKVWQGNRGLMKNNVWQGNRGFMKYGVSQGIWEFMKNNVWQGNWGFMKNNVWQGNWGFMKYDV